MEIYFKFTAGLLLMVHAFQLASLQDSTDSPGRTIDPKWLRDLARNKTGRQNAVDDEELPQDVQDTGASTMDTSNEKGAIWSGYMLLEDDVNSGHEEVANTSHELPHALPNGETEQPELSNATDSQTPQPTNSSQANKTEAEEESDDSTTTPQNSTARSSSPNSTDSPVFSNRTDLQPPTSAPESNGTRGSETEPEGGVGSSGGTTSVAPQERETSTTPSPTTAFPPETTGTSPVPPTLEAAQVNKTDKDGAAGSSTDRGVSSDNSSRSNAWGAVLGTAVAVSCVGLVAYIILKKKRQKAFAHRKLVETFPSDPVLRLDNSEPLDLNFGRAAYFNPGLQGDNIQMSNFPGHYRT